MSKNKTQGNKFYYWKNSYQTLDFFDWLAKINPADPKIMFSPEECFTHKIDWSVYETHNFTKIVFGACDLVPYSNVNIDKNKIILWPTFFLTWSMAGARHFTYKQQKNQDYQCLFTCLNYAPRAHRLRLLDRLSKYNLLENNFYSWHGSCDNTTYKPTHWKCTKTQLDIIDNERRGIDSWPKEMDLSVINLVTETYDNFMFVTEKTFRCFLYKKPFIILGSQGIHQKLEQWGFKLPRSIINYSFDTIRDPAERTEAMCIELRRLSKIDYNKLAKSLEHSSEHNFLHAIKLTKNKKIIPKIIKQDEYYGGKIIPRSIQNAQWLQDVFC